MQTRREAENRGGEGRATTSETLRGAEGRRGGSRGSPETGEHFAAAKGSTQHQALTIVNVYAPNNRASKYTRQGPGICTGATRLRVVCRHAFSTEPWTDQEENQRSQVDLVDSENQTKLSIPLCLCGQ